MYFFLMYSLDASVEAESLGRLVNDDNKKPNCKMKIIDYNREPHLCLFALRNIAIGEELCYDYGNADWPRRREVWCMILLIQLHLMLIFL